MDTLSFLKKILPSQGHYVLARFRNGMDKPPAHVRYDSIEQLVSGALAADSRGEQVFHACATFAEARKKEKVIDGRTVQVEATRAKNNVAFTRSQWLDVDVGDGKDYPDQRSALMAIMEMLRTLGLPKPLIVGSGRGFHLYWPFTRDLPGAQAAIMGKAFAAALKDIGFKHDPMRTGDTASILRPVGTHWRKHGEVEVRLVRDADPVSPKEFMRCIAKYAERPKVTMADVFGDEWSSGTKASYPPSSALRIVQFCDAMRHVADLGGDVVEPLWRAMLGVVKFTVEGEDQAHEWSRGAEDYDPAVTQQKLDNWSGPATCSYFSSNCDHCAGCSYAGRVKSPIQLGYSQELPPAAPAEAPAPDVAPVADSHPAPTPAEPEAAPVITPGEVEKWARKMPTDLPFWPKGYAWNGEVLQRAVEGEDGAVQWMPFSTRLFYPYLRHPGDDGTYVIKISALINAKRGRWRDFDIPAETVAEDKALARALGAFEIYAIGKNGKAHMRHFVHALIDSMQEHDIETTTYNAFGWHDEGFVIGSTRLTAKGAFPVFLGNRVPPTMRNDFGVSGTAEEWAELIDTIYNRPGAEPYQFILMAAFGAPLVKLCNADMWHGIPIALTGANGLGKTTTCKAACTIFGDPRHFAISTNESGSTMNALIQNVALMRNLPIVLDELTGRTPKELQDMLYALSNGKPKQRSKADGSLNGLDLTWDTISFITGNVDITGLLSQLDRTRAEATQMRCFEIQLPEDFNNRIFAGLNAKDLIEGELLAKQYGAAGRKFLAYVMAHRDAITAKLQRARAAVAPTTRDETRERFYLDCLVTAMVGGAIAQGLGLIKFDIGAVKKWALRHIKGLRTVRAAASYGAEDYFQGFLSSLHGRTVVTNHFGDGRIHRDRGPEFIDESKLRNPIARHAVKDRKFLVTVRGFNDWAVEQQVNPVWLRDELDKRGYLVHYAGGKDDRQRIFRGTNIACSPVRCLEFVYDKIDSGAMRPPLAVVESSEAGAAV